MNIRSLTRRRMSQRDREALAAFSISILTLVLPQIPSQLPRNFGVLARTANAHVTISVHSVSPGNEYLEIGEKIRRYSLTCTCNRSTIRVKGFCRISKARARSPGGARAGAGVSRREKGRADNERLGSESEKGRKSERKGGTQRGRLYSEARQEVGVRWNSAKVGEPRPKVEVAHYDYVVSFVKTNARVAAAADIVVVPR